MVDFTPSIIFLYAPSTHFNRSHHSIYIQLYKVFNFEEVQFVNFFLKDRTFGIKSKSSYLLPKRPFKFCIIIWDNCPKALQCCIKRSTLQGPQTSKKQTNSFRVKSNMTARISHQTCEWTNLPITPVPRQ
jgi:hypothetical protein